MLEKEMIRGGLTFDQWCREVDKLARAKYGFGIHDGMDWASWDTFSKGRTPKQGVAKWRKTQSEF